jgi:glycosyltransferase involved in cell wall biosynthesis
VQALTYPNLIHVILDNASTDATPEIIKAYSNGHVPLLTARNAKTIPKEANFNAAVQMIPREAAYFRLLCADDLMAPESISKKVELAERDPEIGIVGCLCRVTGLKGQELPQHIEIFDGRDIVRRFLMLEHSVLHRTEFLIRCLHNDQPFYDETFDGASDTDANIRVALSGKFGFIHEELATFRWHELGHFWQFSQANLNLAEWLIILDRYGPAVLTIDNYRRARAAFRRHYLRRLLMIRYRDRDEATFDKHMAIYRKNNELPGLFDYIDALAEWAYLALTRRRHLVGVAR